MRYVFSIQRQGRCWLLASLLAFVCTGSPAYGELVSTVELSCPALTQFPPGSSDSFFTDALSGPSAYNNGSIDRTYTNILRYTQSTGGGRFSTFNGVTRYGVAFDSFQLFQSFLTPRYFTTVSSGTACPASGPYNWIFVRYRTPEVLRSAMDAADTTLIAGGTLSYDGSGAFSGTKDFSIAALGSANSSASYSLNGFNSAVCANGHFQVAAGGSSSFDPYGTVYFGSSDFLYFSQSGNPEVALGVPQVTLSGGTMSALGNYVFTGLFTEFVDANTQTQVNIQLAPDAAGTTYDVRSADSLTDATSYTSIGTLTCTTLNAPFNGFCKGTLYLNTPAASQPIACEVSPSSTENLIACGAVSPNNAHKFVSIIATTPARAVLQVTQATIPQFAAPGSAVGFSMTVKNLTGRYIPSLAEPASAALKLATPFSTSAPFTGSGGTCGSTLKGFASCNVSVSYAPQNFGAQAALYRVAYDTGADGTMNATGIALGTAGLTGLTVTSASGSYVAGTSAQLTAIATFSNGLTQDVTNVVNWNSSATSVASVSPYGVASFSNTGKMHFTATLGANSADSADIIVSAPDVLGLSATPLTGTSIQLNWISGGGATAAFQIAYFPGAAAPADCSSGTVISSATIGAATTKTITGLIENTLYSFRVCSADSASPVNLSPGVVVKATTPGKQQIFVTVYGSKGNFGGLYFADFICQQEAIAGGRPGTWKALLGDASVAASSHVTVTSSLYNFNPAGAALIATGSGLFNSASISNAVGYHVNGSGASGFVWTGADTTGSVTANTCTSWTNKVSGNGMIGYAAVAANTVSLGGSGYQCNLPNPFFCINGQTVSATAPPDPASLIVGLQTPGTIDLVWQNGGGNTAAYQIAYRTGNTAPADCNSNTVIAAATVGKANPNLYTVNGLTPNTTYSFRLCATNSTLSAFSTGLTATATTTTNTTSSRQSVFYTSTTYPGNFGGVYFGDFICQQDAVKNGRSGIWKAVLSDATTSAASRITLSAPIYNVRSAGPQYMSAASDFFGGAFITDAVYNVTGTTTGFTGIWTGTQLTGGGSATDTCNSWTTNAAATKGVDGIIATSLFNYTSVACSGSLALICIDGQSASGAPGDPSALTAAIRTTNSIQLTWTAGTGTTGGYQIAYQTGATAPANCSTGTVISATTVGGGNTGNYVVNGLTSNTNYAFRVCSVNSDISSISAGTTLATSTTASGSSGSYQSIFVTRSSYVGLFGGINYADYLCQREAAAAGQTGVWKALLSDSSANASARLTISGPVFNFNPAGPELVATTANFWSNSWNNAVKYSAIGSPSTNLVWTGSIPSGSADSTCSNWSTGSFGGSVGDATSNTYGIEFPFASGVIYYCSNSAAFYCINGQSSSAAPPDPTGLGATASGARIALSWTSGGGSSAAFQIAYQTGGTAPATCSTGTILTQSNLGTGKISSYTLVGLSPSTTYSFRICALNSDSSSMSAGATVSATTGTGFTATDQYLFATKNTYNGGFGGIYFGDFICQQEALAAGRAGIFKAILSDASTAASSHISVGNNVYNLNPAAPVQLATSAAFWGGTFSAGVTYNEFGTSLTGSVWTGSTAAGAIKTGIHCSGWTSGASSASGWVGNSTSTTAAINSSSTTCNNSLPIYCIGGQTASGTPSDPTGLSAPLLAPNSVVLSWANGGGTTAAYQIAYAAGSTAPANCTTGTVVPAAMVGVANPVSYTVTGLAASTTYAFRLCAANSNLSAFSTGVTTTATTTASGYSGSLQTVFATKGTFLGTFGGLYFADGICQQEASAAGLGGVWKAVLSDSSTSAASRLTLSSAVYTPARSGPRLVAKSGNFWAPPYLSTIAYNANGDAISTSNVWTGTTSAGAIKTSSNCTNWTSGTASGWNGVPTSLSAAVDSSSLTCSGAYSLYCLNGQTASAAPADPSNFAASLPKPNGLLLTWSNGGGTTAGYRIAYQTGATAPANCNSGTQIDSPTIGQGNVNDYFVSGLTANTQYSFRLCAVNSDVSLQSTGVTVTASTAASSSDSSGAVQTIFVTSSTYKGNLGGLYFADFICQQDAAAAGISGIWRAVMSDATTAASTHITINGPVFNLNPMVPDLVSTASGFWTNTFANAVTYAANGAKPNSLSTWSGATATGGIGTNTCTSWTSSSGAVSGGEANMDKTYGTIAGSNSASCNSSEYLICINGQASATGTLPDPGSFAAATASAGTTPGIALSWTGATGITGGYQIAYNLGDTAPANCVSGTVIGAGTVGKQNPLAYTVRDLVPGAQYTFRICSVNSDISSFSTGVTTTAFANDPALNQVVFATKTAYAGNFGGQYFADFICQKEANDAGMKGGTWKALLASSTATAASRVTLTGATVNSKGQSISTSANFWSTTGYTTAPSFTATGGAPGSSQVWTGSTAAGAGSGSYCTDWTTNSSGVSGTYGTSTSTSTTALSASTDTCDKLKSIYCISNQAPAATAPTDGATLTAPTLSTTSIGLSWSAGSGTVGAYQIAYRSGATAPTDCTSNTVISGFLIGVMGPTTYTVTGLSPNTQYSFRVCAATSDLTRFSTGLTVSATTTLTSTSNQLMFATSGVYDGDFGSVYFGDFICQNEAQQAGYTGVWKALLSTAGTQAFNRIARAATIYNTNGQAIATSANFWNTSGWSNAPNRSNTNGTPGSVSAWTGATASGGIATAMNCQNWTSNQPADSAEIGTDTATTTSGIDAGSSSCSNLKSLYCINQQTASAAPPDVATFTSLSVDTSSITFQWTSGGGTTAAYQLAYQAGGSAPASCSVGTIVTPFLIGAQNPNSYTVYGLPIGKTYSFRLCAVNSDLSQISSGKTLLSLQVGQDASPAMLSFAQARYDLGKTTGQNINTALILINKGSLPATSLSGSSAGGFDFTGSAFPGGTGGSYCGTTLPAYSSCVLGVTFTPTFAGTVTADLTINYSDGFGARSVATTLTAVDAVGAILTSSPTSYNYGSVSSGSVDETFTITNIGSNSAQAITPHSLAVPYSFKGGSYPGTGGTCGSALAAAASCTIVVTFTPYGSNSTYQMDVDLDYNAGLTSQTLTVTVQGSVP